MCGWSWGWGGNGWGWGGTAMTIVLAVLLVAVIIAVVVAIRDLATGGSQHHEASSAGPGPEDMLAHRFARGEIDENEYRRRIALLREHL